MPRQYYYNFTGSPLYDFRDKERAMFNYCAIMLNRTRQIFQYTGLPETIPAYMLERILQLGGFACFAKVGDDVYAFSGGLGGEPDPYYRPTICTVANPALKFDKALTIGTDCTIVMNDSGMQGLAPIFNRYATALVENDISFEKAVQNARAAFIITAPDDNTREAAEKFLDDLAAGKSGAIQTNAFLDGLTVNPLATAASRIISELVEYQQYLKASWFNELGLNANYNMKRESLTTAETDMNFDALLPLIDDMLQCRQRGLEKVNEMFGLNISVSLGSAWADIHDTAENPEKQDDETGGETQNETEQNAPE